MLSLRHQLQERSEEVNLLAEDCVLKDERIQELERAVAVVAKAVLPLQSTSPQRLQAQPPLPPGPLPSSPTPSTFSAAVSTFPPPPPPPRLPALPPTPMAGKSKTARFPVASETNESTSD